MTEEIKHQPKIINITLTQYTIDTKPDYSLGHKVDKDKLGVDPRFEKYLWRFKNPANKQNALLGIVKILR